jgi:hypothetical protein
MLSKAIGKVLHAVCVMSSSHINQSVSLPDVYFQVWESGTMSLSARTILQASLLEEQLKEADRALIDRLLYAVRQGWVSLAGA